MTNLLSLRNGLIAGCSLLLVGAGSFYARNYIKARLSVSKASKTDQQPKADVSQAQPSKTAVVEAENVPSNRITSLSERINNLDYVIGSHTTVSIKKIDEDELGKLLKEMPDAAEPVYAAGQVSHTLSKEIDLEIEALRYFSSERTELELGIVFERYYRAVVYLALDIARKQLGVDLGKTLDQPLLKGHLAIIRAVVQFENDQ